MRRLASFGPLRRSLPMSPARGYGLPARLPAQARQVPYDYYKDSNLIKTCPKEVNDRTLTYQARAVACVASSENRYARMSTDARRTAFALPDPPVSNSKTIRVHSLPAFTASTWYCPANFVHAPP